MDTQKKDKENIHWAKAHNFEPLIDKSGIPYVTSGYAKVYDHKAMNANMNTNVTDNYSPFTMATTF